MSRLVRVVQGAALRVEGALLVRISGTPIHGAQLILVVALLPLKALEVRILARADLILLRIGQHGLLRYLLGVQMHVLVALLELFRRLRVHGLVVRFARDHVVVVLLYLLIAHDLVQFHLTVGELAGVDFLVLRRVRTHLRNLVHIHVRPLLAVHVVVLTLTLRPSNLMRIIIMILELIKLRLRLVVRVVVQRVQVVRTHLLHVRWVVLELAAVRHCHVLEHLLLRDRNVPAHRAGAILVHLLHLGRTRTLVAHHFFVIITL